MQKIKPYRSKKHLAWIRTKPCCHCGTNLDVVAHHLISCGLGGSMGGKNPDSLTIPLCVKCHAIVHAAGGTVAINQLKYFHKQIELALWNDEIVGDVEINRGDLSEDDLIDFAKQIRDAFDSSEMVLK